MGKQFPDIAQAIRKAGGDDGGAIAVAVCPEAGRWAVGVGNGWKGREFATKLAMAVSLAHQDQHIVAALERSYPGFAHLCEQINPGIGKLSGADLSDLVKAKAGVPTPTP